MTESGDHIEEPAPDHGRRKLAVRFVAGAAGLAVLGGGAYALTTQLMDRGTTTALSDVPIGTMPAPPEASSAAPPSPSPSAAPEVTKEPSAVPPEVAKEIDEARRKMAEDGVKVQRAITPSVTTSAADIKVRQKGSLQKGGIVRIVTARGDLTGQRELAWVSGGIQKYDGVPCSSTIKVSADRPAEKKANLLICWRTSEKKSVISIVVDPDGHPSAEKAVTALDEKWRSMG
jgi:hypothetical protein